MEGQCFGAVMNITRLLAFLLLLVCGLTSCSGDVVPISEAEYSAKIVGD